MFLFECAYHVSTVHLPSFNLVNGCFFSSSAVVKEVGGTNSKTKDLEETRKKKKKRKHKDFREEEEKPRKEEELHRELRETNGDESPSQMRNTDTQKPSKPNTGINTLAAVRS